MNNIEPTKIAISFPYSVKIEIPLVETVLNTKPKIPSGAKSIIQETTLESPLAISLKICFVLSFE